MNNGKTKELMDRLQMLDDKQVSSLLRLTKRELLNAVAAGLLPEPIRFGRELRWPAAWLVGLLEREAAPAAEHKED